MKNRSWAPPNAMYQEYNAFPTIETPMFLARALQDISIIAYNDIIRIFTALPSTWKNVSFENFSVDGGFLVSAKHQDGKTQFIKIESLCGEKCKVKSDMHGMIRAYGNREFKVTELGNGVVSIDIKKGESVVLYNQETLPDLNIIPVDVTNEINQWGVK